MNATDVLGYAYEAAIHCVMCAESRFDVDALADGTATDSEGNKVTPYFADEAGATDRVEHCDDCGADIYTPDDHE